MDRNQYDERQLAARNKAALTTLFLLAVLVFVNAFVVDSVGAWAAPFEQAMTVVIIPMTYFAVRVIWTDAYFGVRNRFRTTIGIFAGLCAIYLVAFGVQAARGDFQLWINGHAGNVWSPFVMFVFFATIIVTASLRRWLDGRASEDA